MCGATSKDRPLHVDHIIPRTRKGKNTEDNLQVQCSKCNLGKSNKDDTDFRVESKEVERGCPFCELGGRKVVGENSSVVAIVDSYPATEGHTLVLPKHHTLDYFEMTEDERHDATQLLRKLRQKLQP